MTELVRGRKVNEVKDIIEDFLKMIKEKPELSSKNLKDDEKNKVNIDMTLTSPNCPVAESLPNEVKENIKKVEGASDVNLNIVWDPPWDKDKMSEAAKLELNL